MKLIRLWPVCLLMVCAPNLMMAAAPDLEEQQMSVRELMRLDTALALEQARERLRKQRKGQDVANTVALNGQSGALKLVAIYGVGKKLLAEVMVGERTHVYMRGQAWAVGVKGDASAYRLRGISGSCVHLERADEGHTLCLHPGMRGHQ